MTSNNLKQYSLEEVAKHSKADDGWVVIKNKVYDVTKWMPKHPGGAMLISNLAGQDCTDEFKIFHIEPNFKLLNAFMVGEVIESERKYPSELAKDVEILHEKLKKKGVFKPDYWFYFQRATIISSLFVTCLFLLTTTSSMLPCIISAVCLGLAWQQLAFVGHDLGHHVVTHDRKLDDKIAVFVGNILQGISLEWWKYSHNTHHTLTNSVTHDPDIQHLPFMAVSKEFFKSIFSLYHYRKLEFDWFAQKFVSIQHYMFYIIMALARFNLYAQSFIHNIIGPGSKFASRQKVELASLAAFWVWYLVVLSLTNTWGQTFAFLLVSHAAAGLVHVQICISHFSMETYNGVPQRSFSEDGYIRSQLMTTCNVDCYPILDFFHGGLQFQIEHHIFPHLTRSKLRYVQGELQQLCKKHNIAYFNKSFYEANRDVVQQLYNTSKELKLSDMFIDGLNLVG